MSTHRSPVVGELGAVAPTVILFVPVFNNLSYGQPDTFFWDLGDGTITSDIVPVGHGFLAINNDTTIYNTQLVVENGCRTDTMITLITALPNTVTSFFNTDPPWGCLIYLFLALGAKSPEDERLSFHPEAVPDFLGQRGRRYRLVRQHREGSFRQIQCRPPCPRFQIGGTSGRRQGGRVGDVYPQAVAVQADGVVGIEIAFVVDGVGRQAGQIQPGFVG